MPRTARRITDPDNPAHTLHVNRHSPAFPGRTGPRGSDGEHALGVGRWVGSNRSDTWVARPRSQEVSQESRTFNDSGSKLLFVPGDLKFVDGFPQQKHHAQEEPNKNITRILKGVSRARAFDPQPKSRTPAGPVSPRSKAGPLHRALEYRMLFFIFWMTNSS